MMEVHVVSGSHGGQVFASGKGKRLDDFGAWQRVYCVAPFLGKPKIFLKKLHQFIDHALFFDRSASAAKAGNGGMILSKSVPVVLSVPFAIKLKVADIYNLTKPP